MASAKKNKETEHPDKSTSNPKLTYELLAKHEPQLNVLLRRARSASKMSPSPDPSIVWYEPLPFMSLNEQLSNCVGWRREDDPVLGTQRAYDIAFEKIYGALCKASK